MSKSLAVVGPLIIGVNPGCVLFARLIVSWLSLIKPRVRTRVDPPDYRHYWKY